MAPARLTVPSEAAGTRLDQFLAAEIPALSRTRIQRLITAGRVTVDGAGAKAATVLAGGEVLTVEAPEPPDPDAILADANLPLEVLYQDAALIVVDKAAGQVVHPAAGHAADTLVNALVARFPDLVAAFEGRRPGIVHRLDKDTSGVLVVGRTPVAADALMRQFKDRAVEKSYLTIVKGTPSPAAGRIEAPIQRDRHHRQRMAAQAGGRPAETDFQVLATSGDYSLILARPRTGRTHQIRVHLAAIGHPVAGDTLYGRRDRALPRLALHAWRLAFRHPVTGEPLLFTAPWPPDLAAAQPELGLRWEEPAPPP